MAPPPCPGYQAKPSLVRVTFFGLSHSPFRPARVPRHHCSPLATSDSPRLLTQRCRHRRLLRFANGADLSPCCEGSSDAPQSLARVSTATLSASRMLAFVNELPTHRGREVLVFSRFGAHCLNAPITLAEQ